MKKRRVSPLEPQSNQTADMKEGGGHVPTGAKSWEDPLLRAGEARRVQQSLVAAPDGFGRYDMRRMVAELVSGWGWVESDRDRFFGLGCRH